MKLENDNGKYVWVYCGQVDRYDTVNEFVDFYDDRHRIIRKSFIIESITFKTHSLINTKDIIYNYLRMINIGC